MHSNTSDDRCPVCGQEYEKLMVLEKPVDWRDITRKRPVDYFLLYGRRCSSKHDVENDRGLGDGEVAVYFHDPPGSDGCLSIF